MSKATHPYGTVANRYARDVMRGTIAACSYVRQACGRHLNDLERSKSKDYPFRWDREAAERICRFAANMVHVKGREWAGKKIALEPWQDEFARAVEAHRYRAFAVEYEPWCEDRAATIRSFLDRYSFSVEPDSGFTFLMQNTLDCPPDSCATCPLGAFE